MEVIFGIDTEKRVPRCIQFAISSSIHLVIHAKSQYCNTELDFVTFTKYTQYILLFGAYGALMTDPRLIVMKLSRFSRKTLLKFKFTGKLVEIPAIFEVQACYPWILLIPLSFGVPSLQEMVVAYGRTNTVKFSWLVTLTNDYSRTATRQQLNFERFGQAKMGKMIGWRVSPAMVKACQSWTSKEKKEKKEDKRKKKIRERSLHVGEEKGGERKDKQKKIKKIRKR